MSTGLRTKQRWDGAYVLLSLNLSLTLGLPGKDDSIAVQALRDDALWFSSKWNGGGTVEQVIAGGDAQDLVEAV